MLKQHCHSTQAALPRAGANEAFDWHWEHELGWAPACRHDSCDVAGMSLAMATVCGGIQDGVECAPEHAARRSVGAR